MVGLHQQQLGSNMKLKYLLTRIWCGIKQNLIQFRIFRKIFKGKYFKILPLGLQMGPFYSTTQITSCQSITLACEKY